MMTLVIGVCGAVGAIVRFLIDSGMKRAWSAHFPVATTAINVSGSFVLGALLAAVDDGSALALAIGVGFCGGYTTFSTAMFETVALARERRAVAATGYLLGLPVASVVAAAGGYALVA